MTDENSKVVAGDTEETKADNEDQGQDTPTEPSSPDTKTVAKSSSSQQSKSKIDVLLKPAGDAPIMKKKKWAVERNKHISWVCTFIKKYLKCEPSESMFLYVNQSFAPSPDTEIGSVFDCFGSDGKLVLHYCKSQAWG